jgi:GntR family transcriptional regulator, transcriptional repressor for pyruvate dehydrogenase complex
MEQLVRKLVRLYAWALRLPLEYFDQPFREPQYKLRMTHYPYQTDLADDEFGIARTPIPVSSRYLPHRASAPVNAAVCERAALAPSSERPILIRTIGLPRSAAIFATSKNLSASLTLATSIFISINYPMQTVGNFRTQKRGDMVVEEIKRWIAERRLAPGDKLPKEAALQELFGVSKGTAREALKSLEVQGLITVSTGPAGGATISEVPIERTFQLVQNYLFFRDLNVAQIYAVRRMLEPELAAGAVAHLTGADFEALEHSIETCAPTPANDTQARAQRQEDLHFHDVLAAANPNALLRFMCEVINQLLRHLVTLGNQPAHPAYQRLGDTNVAAHRRLLAAARRRDANEVRRLMLDHIDEAAGLAAELAAAMRQGFVSDADLQPRIVPSGRRV